VPPVDPLDFAVTALDRETGERFQSLRRPLAATAVGLNLIVLAPGQRGRIHVHEQQEEIYLVLEGELTLIVDGATHRLGPDQIARIAPAVRRQLVNAGPERVALLAIGAHGEHVGRDALAWAAWDDDGPGRPPFDVPLPGDLPLPEPS
jgi:uncharacterized cupin superfamily protein